MAEEPPPNSVTCPKCGADTPLVAGERILSCTFCDTALFVDRSGAVGHFWLPRLLDAEHARAALKRWMAGNETVKDLDRKSTVEAVEPVSFPMWMFRSRGAAGEQVHVQPAAPTPIPQLADLEVPAGKLEPYRAEEQGVEAVAAIIPLETARGWLAERGVAAPAETSLVRVPLWRCRYSFGGGSYQALVEGSTGQVRAAIFPEKAESPYYLVAALGILLFGIEGLVISNFFAKLVVYGLTAVPLLLLAWWVTRKV